MKFSRLFASIVTVILAATAVSQGTPVITSENAAVGFGATTWSGSLSNSDLINVGQDSLSSATVSACAFDSTGINNGSSSNTDTPGNTFFWVDQNHFPAPANTATATFNLNVSTHTLGYTLTSIQSFMGWNTFSGVQGNQTYKVEVSTVGSADYTEIATVNYTPFADTNTANHESHVTVTDSTGALASGVDSIRFTFLKPAVADQGGGIDGTLVREIDVDGYPTGGSQSNGVTVANPKARQIIQRDGANRASITVNGSYTGTPDSIEARMAVMAGSGNSGTSTPWTTIVATPAAGTYSATLSDVPAGGWYQLEVRTVTGGTPDTATVVERVGIGDIFITCGQSNSANYGSPAATVSDDRVSAWSGGTWTKAADPMPGADGSGGSAWTRLGDLLAARDNVPIGFACLGVGATSVGQWVPPNNCYPRIAAAVKAFPANGFRAALWHQGESDSLASTTPAIYQTSLESIISQSRTDAGWTVPWYIAEVGFHPGSTLAQEEPVVAGQRRTIFADAQVFPGPVTDDFHLESKLIDTVHFNATGLADHANQWAEVLGGTPPLTPKNPNFESNTALADGAIGRIDTTSAASPSVIGWRALAASGETVADGNCGYYNPNNSQYAGATDSEASGGVLPQMAGRHVAFLSDCTAGAQFLQTRRAMLEAKRIYTLTVALGVRGNADTFGGARLEILADGAAIGARTVTLADLHALNGGNASNKFTDIALAVSTNSSVTAGKPLAIRIIKTGGAGTYLDFDQVRFTSAVNPAPDAECDLLSFAWNSYSGVIDQSARTVTVAVPFSAVLTGVQPTLTVSALATVSPASGQAVDFSNSAVTPVAYTVTAEDGVTTKVYQVSFVRQPDTLTTTTLVASANPSLEGDNVTFTATVKAGGIKATAATGTYQFKIDGEIVQAAAPIVGGEASFTTNTLTAGSHAVAAVYSGDTVYITSSANLTQGIAQAFKPALTDRGDGYTVATFSTVGIGSWKIPAHTGNLEVLVIGGGGSGSYSNGTTGGGGGSGGFYYTNSCFLTAGTSVTVTVGAGGAGATVTGNDGSASVFGDFIAYGGLGGGTSGGASGGNNQGAAGFAGGANLGGGGGAGQPGAANWFSAPKGGDGLSSAITGTTVWYAGGGSGCYDGADGGLGGGGSTVDAAPPGNPNGINGLGGGGAGARFAPTESGAGGSGIVIIAYLAPTETPYTSWANNYSGVDLTEPTADCDGDGMTNQQEFAFGLNPTQGSSANPITTTSALQSQGQFSYTRRTDSGLTYTVWTSPDLLEWTADPAADQVAGTAVDGVETVTVTLSSLPTANNWFVRIAAD